MMLAEMKRLFHGNLNNKTVVIDYEVQMINALKAHGVAIKGCNFHFTKCIKDHVNDAGFKKRYVEDTVFMERMTMVRASNPS